jgi:hypothetical protein
MKKWLYISLESGYRVVIASNLTLNKLHLTFMKGDFKKGVVKK